MLQDVLLATGGLALLLVGAELLVRGASALALRLGLTPLVVGLTVVAFGTSSPELVVSLSAAAADQPGVALGNIVGSNICNLGLILGLSALVRPLAVEARVIRQDAPLMLAVTLGVVVLLADGRLDRWEGLLLLAGAVAFTALSVRQGRREAAAIQQEFAEGIGAPARSLPWTLLAIGGGLALLSLGARWLVLGAVDLARGVGVSETVIGLTLVAVGTSLPELATSLLAAARGQADLAVANVVGSNLFNLLGILGPTAIFAPLASVPVSAVDLGVMVAISLLAWPLLRSGARISRWEGGLLLTFYAGYLGYLVAFGGG